MTNYDYDLVIWDTVGGAYDANSMRRASGGSEKEVVQLAEGLGKRGLKVCCFNQTRDPFGDGGAAASEWMNLSAAKNIRCKILLIQRYSPIPEPEQVLADRMVVRATDVYGDYYKLGALTHLCVSEWQAEAFRSQGFPVKVIPAMLDDDYYDLASTPKVKGRFIYASAWTKGLDPSVAKWLDLKHRFPNEMRDCELHITSPGYGKQSAAINDERNGVRVLEDFPPRELAKYMATCEGLFYCNVFPETFCAVAAIAGAVGCRVHVLAKRGLSGISEAAAGFLTEDEDEFDRDFVKMLGQCACCRPEDQPADFRVSTILPQWLSALTLSGEPQWPTSISSNSPSRSPHDMSDAEKQNLVGEFAAKLNSKIIEAYVPDFDKKKEAPVNKTPKVCLVMLAHNAETTIRRALESIRGFVDCAIFQFNDMKSATEMRRLILELWPHHETSIPVEFTYRSWVNFRENRNTLLDDARKLFGETYVLALDADDRFVGLQRDFISRLILDCYEVEIREAGDLRYARRMLWRNDGRFRYEGPAHEFLTEGTNRVTTGRLQGVYYERLGGPQLSVEDTRKKYLRDVLLFVDELERNPEDTRSAFYLAQSLEDAACGDVTFQKQALRGYEKRMAMAGFIQERFVAAMKVGKLRKGFGLAEGNVVSAFVEAAKMLPERAPEAVYEIILYYNNEGNSKERAVAAHETANLTSFVAPEGFIVDHSIYQWGYRFQLAIALCYVGRKDEAKSLFEDLLTTAPAWVHGTIRSNLTFCVPPVRVDADFLAELKAAYGVRPPALDIPPSNPPMPGEVWVGQTRPPLEELAEGLKRAAQPAAVPWFIPKNV